MKTDDNLLNNILIRLNFLNNGLELQVEGEHIVSLNTRQSLFFIHAERGQLQIPIVSIRILI